MPARIHIAPQTAQINKSDKIDKKALTKGLQYMRVAKPDKEGRDMAADCGGHSRHIEHVVNSMTFDGGEQ